MACVAFLIFALDADESPRSPPASELTPRIALTSMKRLFNLAGVDG
jgi:hypothetical protein